MSKSDINVFCDDESRIKERLEGEEWKKMFLFLTYQNMGRNISANKSALGWNGSSPLPTFQTKQRHVTFRGNGEQPKIFRRLCRKKWHARGSTIDFIWCIISPQANDLPPQSRWVTYLAIIHNTGRAKYKAHNPSWCPWFGFFLSKQTTRYGVWSFLEVLFIFY